MRFIARFAPYLPALLGPMLALYIASWPLVNGKAYAGRWPGVLIAPALLAWAGWSAWRSLSLYRYVLAAWPSPPLDELTPGQTVSVEGRATGSDRPAVHYRGTGTSLLYYKLDGDVVLIRSARSDLENPTARVGVIELSNKTGSTRVCTKHATFLAKMLSADISSDLLFFASLFVGRTDRRNRLYAIASGERIRVVGAVGEWDGKPALLAGSRGRPLVITNLDDRGLRTRLFSHGIGVTGLMGLVALVARAFLE